MPTAEHVKRLVRELELPDQADLVVQQPKYWTPEFCWLYFERCDALISEVPTHGLAAADVCPELVYLTKTVTRQPQDRLRLRALAILGSALRATDESDQAENTYRQAFELIRESDTILQSDAANVLFRYSYVLCFRNRYEAAVKAASQSIRIYREASSETRRRHLGEALTARGFVHHMHGHLELAMKDWGEALPSTDVKLTPRVFFAVVHNLALGMTESVVPPYDLATIEEYVAQASRFFSGKPLSVPKLKVLWLRGLIMMRFGSTRRGEALYRKVIAGFLKLGNIVEMALVSVTLAKHLHAEHRSEELEELAIETARVCERLCQNQEIARAVFIWKEAVVAQTVSEKVFTTTWRMLERHSFAVAVRLNADAISSASGRRVSGRPHRGSQLNDQ